MQLIFIYEEKNIDASKNYTTFDEIISVCFPIIYAYLFQIYTHNYDWNYYYKFLQLDLNNFYN